MRETQAEAIARLRGLLTPRQMEIAALWWFDGLPQEEIAARLDPPVSQQFVADQLRRIRVKLEAAGIATPANPARRKPGVKVCSMSLLDDGEV